MKYSIVAFPAALLLTLSSCEKVIEAKDLPQQDPMLVVNSLIDENSNVYLKISSSKSILSGKDYKMVNDAVCDLYEDDVFLASVNTGLNGFYLFGVTPKANKKYSVHIGATGFKSVSATTSIPENIVATTIERYDTTNSTYKYSDYGPNSGLSKTFGGLGKFRFSIIDNINIKNYYGIHPVVILYDSTGQATKVEQAYTNSNITGGIDNGTAYYGQSLVLTDETIVNGKEVQADISVSFTYQFDKDPDYKIHRMEIYLELSNQSEEYFKYQKTLNEQAGVGASFFAEPVLVYNNITNGAGIFAGSSKTLVKIYPQ